MTKIEWATPAFRRLEALPPPLAFAVVEQVDLLAAFPEMGAPVTSKSRVLARCRQLIVSRNLRVIYEVEGEDADRTVYVLAVQRCRQRLPGARELKRRRADDEESGGDDSAT